MRAQQAPDAPKRAKTTKRRTPAATGEGDELPSQVIGGEFTAAPGADGSAIDTAAQSAIDAAAENHNGRERPPARVHNPRRAGVKRKIDDAAASRPAGAGRKSRGGGSDTNSNLVKSVRGMEKRIRTSVIAKMLPSTPFRELIREIVEERYGAPGTFRFQEDAVQALKVLCTDHQLRLLSLAAHIVSTRGESMVQPRDLRAAALFSSPDMQWHRLDAEQRAEVARAIVKMPRDDEQQAARVTPSAAGASDADRVGASATALESLVETANNGPDLDATAAAAAAAAAAEEDGHSDNAEAHAHDDLGNFTDDDDDY